MRTYIRDIDARFAASYEVAATGCWLWTRVKTPQGYGLFWNGQRRVGAHRYSYERFVGPIPTGLTIDHLCRVHSCINPQHLEAVTNRENALRGVSPVAQRARQTHCKRGHEFTPENTYRVGKHGRGCRQCSYDYHHDPAVLARKAADHRRYNARRRARRATATT